MNGLIEKAEAMAGKRFSWQDQFNRYLPQIKAALQGDEAKAAAFTTAATQKLILGPPELKSVAAVNPNSAVLACLQAASLGLQPAVPNEFHLVGYGYDRRTNTVKSGAAVAMVLGYKGLLKLTQAAAAAMGEQYKVLAAHAVYANDRFHVYAGSEPSILHEPDYLSERGELRGFYALAVSGSGALNFHVMSVNDVNKHQARFTRSSFLKDPENFEAYGLKTVIRLLVNRQLPLDTTLAEVLAREDSNENKLGALEELPEKPQPLESLDLDTGDIVAEVEKTE